MQAVEEIIKLRSSVRTFSEEGPQAGVIDSLVSFLSGSTAGLFGNGMRFGLVVLRESQRQELKMLSSYGVIRRPYAYIIGAVKTGRRCLVDYGFAMEKNILHSAGLGLGTCWLGGSFSRSGFSRKFELAKDEILPAVSPVGIPAAKKSLLEGVMRLAASSKHRKPWEELFFQYPEMTALSREHAGKYLSAFEAVRLAPSAMNKQPWRLVMEGSRIHFFLDPSRTASVGEIRFAEIDLGIALCHFSLVAAERGLSGMLIEMDTARLPKVPDGWDYIMTWEDRV